MNTYLKLSSWILSGSSSGEIIVWDAKKLEKIDAFKLKDPSLKLKMQLVNILTTNVYLIFSNFLVNSLKKKATINRLIYLKVQLKISKYLMKSSWQNQN